MAEEGSGSSDKITVVVKTPKEKKNIEIGADASVDDVSIDCDLDGEFNVVQAQYVG